MSVHRNRATLLEVTEAASEDQTGSTYAVLPSDADAQNDAGQGFRAFFALTQSGGVTSPTTDAVVETSPDGTNWVTVASATQLTSDGSGTSFVDIAALAGFVRARTTLGGATNPDHTAKIVLVSNGPFRLRLVA